MASYTAVVTVGPQFPVVYYGFPSREVHDLWFGMVDRARNLVTDTEPLWNWTSDDQMVAYMAEWFGLLERIVRDFGIQMIPPDIYSGAENSNRTLQSLGRPRMDAFDADCSEPPRHAGCELLGIYDPVAFGQGRLVPFRPSS